MAIIFPIGWFVMVILYISYLIVGIIDIVHRRNKEISNIQSLIWIAILLLLPFVGIFLYLLLSYKPTGNPLRIAVFYLVGIILLYVIPFLHIYISSAFLIFIMIVGMLIYFIGLYFFIKLVSKQKI